MDRAADRKEDKVNIQKIMLKERTNNQRQSRAIE
jgi:hypothetical protein